MSTKNELQHSLMRKARNMGKKAFDKIAEGLNEALEIARGERKPAKLHVPAEINVREIRAKTKMSQDDFAAAFGFTVNQIKDWEQNRCRPLGGNRAYLMLIKDHAEQVLVLLQAKSRRKAA